MNKHEYNNECFYRRLVCSYEKMSVPRAWSEDSMSKVKDLPKNKKERRLILKLNRLDGVVR